MGKIDINWLETSKSIQNDANSKETKSKEDISQSVFDSDLNIGETQVNADEISSDYLDAVNNIAEDSGKFFIGEKYEKKEEQSPESTVLSQIEATISERKASIQAEKDAKRGIGAFVDGVAGIFGKGTKEDLNEIEELEELYAEVAANPTRENIEKLYKTVYGEDVNWTEMEQTVSTSKNLADGNYVKSDGTPLTMEDVTDCLEEQVQALDAYFNGTVDEQGLISKGLSWINNNIVGLGETENMTQAQLDRQKEIIKELKATTDPEKYAALYKELTGEELTEESLNNLLNGSSMVSESRAAESIMDYEETQEVAMTAATGVVTGIVTATCGPFVAAAVGAGLNAAVRGIDAATQNNGKSPIENIETYVKEELLKDLALGAINGFSGAIGNKASSLINVLGKGVQTTAGKVAVRVAGEFVEGAIDGGISNAGEYGIACATGEEEFSISELAERVALGGAMGGVFSVGIGETTALVGGLFNAKNIDTDIDADQKAGLDPSHEYGKSVQRENGEWYTYDKTTNEWVRDYKIEDTLKNAKMPSYEEKAPNSVQKPDATQVPENSPPANIHEDPNVTQVPDSSAKLMEKYKNGNMNQIDWNNLLNDEYQKLRKTGKYQENYPVNLTSDPKSLQDAISREYDGVLVLEQKGWFYRMNKSFESDDRFSLNVTGDTKLISELDMLMKNGTYIDEFGRKIKVADPGEFYYKTPDNTSRWSSREDPITIYCDGKASPELQQAIEYISEKYKRGDIGVAPANSTTPWCVKEHQPSAQEVQDLCSTIYKLDKTFGAFVKQKFGTKNWSISAGQYRVLINLYEEYKKVLQMNNI